MNDLALGREMDHGKPCCLARYSGVEFRTSHHLLSARVKVKIEQPMPEMKLGSLAHSEKRYDWAVCFRSRAKCLRNMAR